MSSQVVMIGLEELISSNHIYRKFKSLWNFDNVKNELKKIETDNNYIDHGIEILSNVVFRSY